MVNEAQPNAVGLLGPAWQPTPYGSVWGDLVIEGTKLNVLVLVTAVGTVGVAFTDEELDGFIEAARVQRSELSVISSSPLVTP